MSNVMPSQAMPTTKYAVVVEKLGKKFGSFTAVSDLSFTIHRGEIFGLLGPNGSGKTTTLNMISGLSEETSGSVSVFGLHPRKQSSAVRRLLGVVPQETALYDELSAERNLAFHAELFGFSGADKKQRVSRMLELAQLTHRAKSRAGTFSGGMKRRLALVRALLHEPWLIYLDEPTLGVDVQSRNAIWDYIRQMKQEGRSVLLTTNYLDEVNALCDRVAIIDHGRLVALDTPQALKETYGNHVVEILLDGVPIDDLTTALQSLDGVKGLENDDKTLRITLTSRANSGVVLPALLNEIAHHKLAVHRMDLREPTMDEVFLAVTGRGLRD